jgi:hypothetical protein
MIMNSKDTQPWLAFISAKPDPQTGKIRIFESAAEARGSGLPYTAVPKGSEQSEAESLQAAIDRVRGSL